MKVSTNSVYDILLRMRAYFLLESPRQKYTHEEPLRSDLLSSDQMEELGSNVARSHYIKNIKRAPDQLLKRLDDNEKVLLEVRNLLIDSAKTSKSIPPAGEWLLDNFYLIEEQITIGKKHLPKGYSQGLPNLADGPSAGFPRVYDIALEIISHSDGRVDLKSLSGFVTAYQTVHKLTLGELWAIPIMLRLALIENLRRVSSRIALDKIDQNLAAYWVDQMTEAAANDPKNLIILIADMVKSNPPLESPFVAEFTRGLQGKGPSLTVPLTWMEQQLSDTGMTSNELVHFENQKQAADQVSVSNSISSLRFLSTTDWREFVETMSSVDQVLREDTDGIYSLMDFATRDRYRHVVESIAKHSEHSEEAVARMAIRLAKEQAAQEQAPARCRHVGYFLVDKGLRKTQKAAQMRAPGIARMRRFCSRMPVSLYIGSIVAISLLLGTVMALTGHHYGMRGWHLGFIFLLSLFGATQLAVLLVNWISTISVRPELLPRMDFSKGIPPESRSLVIVPCMLNSTHGIDEMAEALEVRYLANTDQHLHYGLLTDFMDAAQEHMPDDDILVNLAIERINQLNSKYKRDHENIFFLFHRPRKWNERERVWMGYERKRGKLAALNNFILHGHKEAFSHIAGDVTVLSNVKFVITLDADTQLPRESAWKLVGTMAHPLNRPIFNKKKQRVTDGYGILQPRVAVSLPKSTSSWYTRMHANDTGLDPYTRVSSDVYQDLFGEGSFIGKGIYDVAMFEQVLHNRFPDNRILSHDLLEGTYVRSGLLSDVQLYEDYPASYHADVKRRQRWIRGDWQIGMWLWPIIPAAGGGYRKNTISTLSRWKVWDNIRRSLVPFTLTLLLLLGWVALPVAGFWTFMVTSFFLLPALVAFIWQLVHMPRDITLKAHLRECARSLAYSVIHIMFAIACLPYEAYYSLDAIIRTKWRMLITKRHLLEWTPSGHVSNSATLWGNISRMWVGPLVALCFYFYLIYLSPVRMVMALPILLLWIISPVVAWLISQPLQFALHNLSSEQRMFLRRTARRTWAFFENFVTEGDNWLPPDNYQEHPVAVVAHRTSPTNIGMSLLANLTAWDFGYISQQQLVKRCNDTLGTMTNMERYQGHLYNWYDTQTLEPLHPRYISTVDSGNLAGHLITLKQGLAAQKYAPLLNPRLFEGLLDTLMIVYADKKHPQREQLRALKERIEQTIAYPPHTLSAVRVLLDNWSSAVAALPMESPVDDAQDQGDWLPALSRQLADTIHDLTDMAPWLSLSDIPARFTALSVMNQIPSLVQLAEAPEHWLPLIAQYEEQQLTPEEGAWLHAAAIYIKEAGVKASTRILLLTELEELCVDFSEMEYRFLYDQSKHLLSIGYNVEEHQRDASYYDLLASEVRLGIFVAISQGKLPQESWFALGRLLTNTTTDPVLVSWSGSMFEYLMPQLVMPAYENTLLHQTNKSTVKRQIEYARQRSIPWGISESGYNMVDASLNYQYRAFGVPGLGLKRGLAEDMVIAPYASMLALMVTPEDACQNLQVLDKEGFQGYYGFYEAIDYTASRLPRGQSSVTIRSFMAHHQGMGFLSLAYVLLDQPMQRRFESEPQFQATLLLLQERVPRATIFYSHTPEVTDTHTAVIDPQVRIINTPFTPIPEVQLLSNSKYQVMITNSGGGYSRWKDIALTRWREDVVYDNWGIFCYIKDMESGTYWSNTYQPTQQSTRNYEAIFSQGHAEFRRRDNGLITRTEVVVSPEDDVETRRVKITNRTQSHKVIEVTSYAEIVLTAIAADIAHPAFSNLFVQTEILKDQHAILCTRRPRSAHEAPPSMFHLMTVTGAEVEATGYETDRMQFIGRGNTIAHPHALNNNVDLSDSEGSVLDPIVAIRYRIVIKPNHTATIDMVLGIAETREVCLALLKKYQDKHLKNRAFELSWTHSQVMLRQINASESDAQLYGRMAGSILFANPAMRADPAIINSNYRGQSGLWSYSISGDLPIVLLRVQDSENIELVKQMIQAHAYWRLKGLAVDLVIWNEDHGSYRQLLQDQILSLVSAVGGSYGSDRPGSVFVRSADQISNEDRILFQTVARLIIDDSKGTLSEQVNKRMVAKALPPSLEPPHRHIPQPLSVPVNHRQLIFSNGIGGFSTDGKEYVITTSREQNTPAPWCNVIANPRFGSVISESGSAYSWGENAHSFRLTPWNNDPVTDTSGEAFYIRDEDNGHFWSPCPFPAASKMPYTSRHGFGYSVFEHQEDGIHSEMTVFADIKESMKYVVLKIRNASGKTRKLSATGYVEWVLNDIKAKSGMHIVSEYELDSGALLARNRYNSAFAERVAFFHADQASANSYTCDRVEFIGRNGSIKKPAALGRSRLSGRHGAALEPCAAIQIPFNLHDGQNREIVFRLGKGEHIADARRMVAELKGTEAAHQALERVKAFWNDTLQAVQVETPDRTLNILANGWLTYQTLASRLWARSGYYQSGGAFGFRDQLQDVMSLLHTQPQLAREQILLCASRQFKEGDVQHWWHPPTGRGVRTRCSDDYLWLPFATARYVTTTGDNSILGEMVHFLDGRLLNADEESYYDMPNTLDHSASLYEHCVAAIRHGLQFGVHGLPLIGSGDWNDGMDSVGIKGKGESVWLGFFLYDVLRRFEPLARLNKDEAFATECTQAAAQLQNNIETNAWDGEWYRRAYFDDGTPLGSGSNDECRIDSISQSWAVLSGAGDKNRASQAMQAVDKHLVRRDIGLIQLLDPPFDKSAMNPGYIKGYVPGVRENGGQYTHAAIWTIMAFAALGDNERVWELFSLINPINHGSSARSIKTYKVEPYVAAADVYAVSPHNGRGGWTWYTGSAGWMYHFILESLLGLKLEGKHLSLNPCVPVEWPSFTIRYRFGKTYYHIHVAQTHTGIEDTRIQVDGDISPDNIIALQDDGREHQVEVILPLKSRSSSATVTI